MGWSLKKAFKLPTIKNVFKNPVKELMRGDFSSGIGGGGILGQGIISDFKRTMTKPLPTVPYYADARQAQTGLINNQLGAADKFSRGLADSINEETGAARNEIGQQVNQEQRSARSGANARGMLFSGQRMKQEGDIANEGSKRLAQARSDAIQRALGQEQAMFAQPLQSRANLAETQMQQQGLLDQYKQQTEQQKAAQMAASAGLIGQGMGKGFGNMANNRPFSYGG